MMSFVKSLPYALATAFICSGLALAQAPAGATGTCKNGTSTTAKSKTGACAGHGGVKEWLGNQKQEAATSPSSSQKQQATAPSSSPPAAAAGSQAQEQRGKVRATAAPGGGAGKVCVNTGSKVYHCEGDQYYGKTEKGSYMTEAQAKAQGARPANNKACTG
ncbi:MAG TPA: DUF3761 domain-containing protein [Stellaceae bacterium]|nr:DUF3761 domain-containing protein [Stellaceae bacterium]